MATGMGMEPENHVLLVRDGVDGHSVAEPLELAWTPQLDADGRTVAETAQLAPGVALRRVFVESPALHRSPHRHLVVHLAGRARLQMDSGQEVELVPGTVAVSEDLHGGGHRIIRPSGAEDPRVTLLVELPGADGRDGG